MYGTPITYLVQVNVQFLEECISKVFVFSNVFGSLMNGWFSLSIVGSLIQHSRAFLAQNKPNTAMSQFTNLIQFVAAAIQKWVSSTSSLGSHSY